MADSLRQISDAAVLELAVDEGVHTLNLRAIRLGLRLRPSGTPVPLPHVGKPREIT